MPMSGPFLSTTLRPALVMLAGGTLVLGMLYPLAITGVAQMLFPTASTGSMVMQGSKTVGSELIGQEFTSARYFWGRPSANGYNAAASAASQIGPENPAQKETVAARVALLKRSDPDNRAPIPADLLTASGSGLDPHISVAAANWQVARVARVRGMEAKKLRGLVEKHTEGPQLGLYGEPRVNVLLLNLALDGEGK